MYRTSRILLDPDPAGSAGAGGAAPATGMAGAAVAIAPTNPADATAYHADPRLNGAGGNVGTANGAAPPGSGPIGSGPSGSAPSDQLDAALQARLADPAFRAQNGLPPLANAPAPATLVQVDQPRFNRMLELERADAERRERERIAEQDRLLKAGQAREVITAKDAEIRAANQRAEDAERRARSTIRDRELATTLAGKGLLPHAPQQLMRLWSDDFDTVPDGSGYRVVVKGTYQDATAEIERRLSLPEYANFRLPSTQGGSGAAGMNANPGGQPPGAAAPAAPISDLGGALVAQYKQHMHRPEMANAQPHGLRRIN